MDKEHKVPKRVLINWPEIPQMPQKFSPQAQKFGIFEKSSLWLSIVRATAALRYKVDKAGNYRQWQHQKIFL